MQIKFITVLFFSFLAATGVVAQQNLLDVVYLKNGSIFKGNILVNIIGQETWIEAAGKIYVFNYDEIEKIEMENLFLISEEGLSNELCLGMTVSERVNPAMTYTLFYTFKYKFMCGIGTGFERFGNAGIIPLFGEFRVKPVMDKLSSIFYIKGGYAAGVEDNDRANRGGPLFEIGIGCFNQFKLRNAITLAFGFRYQENKSSDDFWWYGNRMDRNYYYRRVFIKAGLNFQ